MIFKRLSIHNFGIYGSLPALDLTPINDGHFNKPIILFWGKNGVGKTTLVEAIKVCLHGFYALGSRVGRRQYEEYILDKIHKSYTNNNGNIPKSASIEIVFDFVSPKKSLEYKIKRTWKAENNKILEDLKIWVDDQLLSDVLPDQYEVFLRDLISPSITEIFFFDGERIDLFTKEDGNIILGDAIKSLFGVNLVEQLQKDLDVFILRNSSDTNNIAIEEMLREQEFLLNELNFKKAELSNDYNNLLIQINSINFSIANQEKKIISEGGANANMYESLKQEIIILEREIEAQRRKIHDLSSNLLPFAIAYRNSKKVLESIEQEYKYTYQRNANSLVNQSFDKLLYIFSDNSIWQDLDLNFPEEELVKITGKIKTVIEDFSKKEVIPSRKIIHSLSENEYLKMTTWLSQALSEIPDTFSQIVNHLITLEKRYKKISDEINLISQRDSIIQPLINAKNSLEDDKQNLQIKLSETSKEISILELKLTQISSRLKSLHEDIIQKKKENHKISLAIKSKQAFETYQNQLLIEKTKELENHLVNRFNELCRKDSIIDRAEINISTFRISLYRNKIEFQRNQLSAGENQLLAIALIWGLRDISGLPVPIIIDTPLGRLDSDHRERLLHNYFPRASHQIIVLATDTEIDNEFLLKLEPIVSHSYKMEYNSVHDETQISMLQISEAAI